MILTCIWYSYKREEYILETRNTGHDRYKDLTNPHILTINKYLINSLYINIIMKQNLQRE